MDTIRKSSTWKSRRTFPLLSRLTGIRHALARAAAAVGAHCVQGWSQSSPMHEAGAAYIVMCSLSHATDLLERFGYSLLQVFANVFGSFNLLRLLRHSPQLAFNDATYVLRQYRQLFPCVPTSDAAWQVILTIPHFLQQFLPTSHHF